MQDEVDQLKDEVLGLFPWVTAELDGELPDGGRELLRRGRAALAASRYLVLTVGEFKRGKSSLLNALIGQSLFPVDTDIATATVCTLSWGEEPRAVVYFLPEQEDAPAQEPRTIPLTEVPRYATVAGHQKGDPPVGRIDMLAPIPQLRSGLILVDTPGVGSMNPAHTAATNGYLPEADALLFVASAVEPLGTAELAFLAHAYEECPIVFTVVSMIDKTGDEDAVVAQVQGRIADVTGLAPDEVDLVPVSAVRKWNGVHNGDPELLAASGFPELERQLWTRLATTVVLARLGRALDTLQVTATDSAAPLRNELVGLSEPEQLTKLDAELREAQARAAKARAEAPRRSRMLSEELDRAGGPIQRRLRQAFDGVIGEFTEAIEAHQVVVDPAAAINRVVEQIVEAQARANRDLAAAIDEIAARFSDDLTIPLTGTTSENASTPLTIGMPYVSTPNRGFSNFRLTWTGGAAGAAAGIAIGTIATFIFPPAAALIGAGLMYGPVVGFVGGHLFGMYGGWKQAKEQAQREDDAKRRERLRAAVVPKVEATRQVSLEDLRLRVIDETRALAKALDEQLTMAAQQLEASRDGLQQTLVRTAAENQARRRAVEGRLATYAEVDKALTRARLKVETLGRGSDGA
jgi:Dynamin family